MKTKAQIVEELNNEWRLWPFVRKAFLILYVAADVVEKLIHYVF